MKCKLGIIGTGNMAEAIIAGILSKKTMKARDMTGFDIDKERLRKMKKKYGLKGAESLGILCKTSSVILLAVKPQQMKSLLCELESHLISKHLLLSIAAGLDTKFIEKNAGPHRRIIRLMPNTPAIIGMGTTVFYVNKNCNSRDRRMAIKLFSSVGSITEVKKEEWLDAVTALSGSGPAFVYHFVDHLAKGGKALGLTGDLAFKLAVETTAGASMLLKKSGVLPGKLIEQVASRGGTTMAGLKVLRIKKMGNIVAQTLRAAANRAKELRRSV